MAQQTERNLEMADILRVVFSGPCAYVPNIVEGVEGAAASWSVLLPNLSRGWSGDKDGIRADRHLAVLSYNPSNFKSSGGDPDIKIKSLDAQLMYKEYDVFLLDSCQVTFDASAALTVDKSSIEGVREYPEKVSALLANNDPLLRSMEWLPSMNWLRSRLQWFGSREPDYYFDERGRPNSRNSALSAHVLVKAGNLVAGNLDVTSKGQPTIWAFRPYQAPEGMRERKQALAGSVVLELPLQTVVTVKYPEQEVKITSVQTSGDVTLEIKNREAEEILMPDTFEFEPQGVDFDFRYLYTHGKHYDPDCLCYPVPLQVYPGGGGNQAGTCGGNQFQGFSVGFESKIDKW
jgi:hypothetical protein